MKKHFYTSQEVKELLGLNSLRTARARIQALNEELKAQGYWIERGKVPIAYFHQRYPYIDVKEA